MSAAVLTCGLLVSTISCFHERDTKVNVEGGNPPKFIMSGSGDLTQLRIGGPKKLREGIAGEPYIYWGIEFEKTDSERSIEALSPITYGEVPRGYIQIYPEPSQAPPPLLEDELYQANVVTMNANGARLNFAIHKGKVVANPTIRDGKPVFPD